MKTHTLLQKQANPRPARLLTLLRRSGLAGFSRGLFAKRPSLRRSTRSASFFGAPRIHFRPRAHPQPLRGASPRRYPAPQRLSHRRSASQHLCPHSMRVRRPARSGGGRAICFAPAVSLPLCNTRAADHRFPLPMCTGGTPRKLLLPRAVFLPAAAVWQVFREAFLQKGRRSCAIPRFCNARVGFAPVQVVMPAY